MDKHLKLIILLAVCIILCNQLVHLYQLYKVEKIQYTHRQNELINGTIYEFNINVQLLKILSASTPLQIN